MTNDDKANTTKSDGTATTWLMIASEAFFKYLKTQRLSSWAQALAIAGREEFNLSYRQIGDIVGVNREVAYANHQKAIKNLIDAVDIAE